MKPKKIAIKIFMSFLILVLFTHISIFFIMRTFKLDQAKKDHAYYREISMYAFKELFESRFRPHSIHEIRDNAFYRDIISGISKTHNLNIIVTDSLNNILMYPDSKRTESFYTEELKKFSSTSEDIRNPFPVMILSRTVSGDRMKIFLFHNYDTSSSDFVFNMLLTALFVVNLILIFIFSKILTKPVGKFDEAIKSVSKGDFSTRIRIRTHDEFEKLANTFNSMAAKLEEIISEQKETSVNISHELRSPLTRMNVALQILKDIAHDRSEVTDRYFDSIEKEINDMDRLIDGILKYYRMDNFSSQALERINIIEVLSNELAKQTAYFNSLNINIEKTYGTDRFEVDILPSVRSVFENIISNASKYTKKDGFFIVNAENTGDSLTITFENSVDDISGLDVEKITEPFFRGKNAEPVKGSGMGLAIAKKICSQNQCSLSAELSENIFKITLTINRA